MRRLAAAASGRAHGSAVPRPSGGRHAGARAGRIRQPARRRAGGRRSVGADGRAGGGARRAVAELQRDWVVPAPAGGPRRRRCAIASRSTWCAPKCTAPAGSCAVLPRSARSRRSSEVDVSLASTFEQVVDGFAPERRLSGADGRRRRGATARFSCAAIRTGWPSGWPGRWAACSRWCTARRRRRSACACRRRARGRR